MIRKMRRLRAAQLAAMAAVAVALGAAGVCQASSVSDPVTASKWTLSAGANFISSPAKAGVVASATVTGVAGDVVTVAATLGSLGPVSGYAQYALYVRHDYTGDGPGTQGDWWTIAANTATTVTVTPQPTYGATPTRIAAGDIVEIVKLTSLKDILGSGSSVVITKDTDFDETTEGVAYLLQGTSFQTTLFYYVGDSIDPEGWYADYSDYLGDGSTYTFTPDQPLLVVTDASADALVTGVLQAYNLSHYVAGGYNPISTGYAAPSPIGSSNLKESGFVQDTDFDETTEDVLYTLAGTAFANTAFYYVGDSTDPAGWYINYVGPDNTFPLDPGTGFLVNSTGTPYVWRQTLPYNP